MKIFWLHEGPWKGLRASQEIGDYALKSAKLDDTMPLPGPLSGSQTQEE